MARRKKPQLPPNPDGPRPRGAEAVRLIRQLARREGKPLAWAAFRVYRRLEREQLETLRRQADEAEKSAKKAASRPKSP